MNLDDLLENIAPLPEQSKIALKEKIKSVTYPKGHILLKADCVERNVYFIKRGVVRAYKNSASAEVTFWFGLEGAPVLPMNSYVSGKKNYESIELLEDCDLYKINISELKSLYEEDVHLANWGRKLAEQELIKTEERLIAMQFKTSGERYADLITNQPVLLLRVQLGYIASYLGMSQVSLSRIRAKLK